MKWQTAQDSGGDLQAGSAACWERAWVVRSHESIHCGVGVQTPMDFVSGLQCIVQSQPASPLSIVHQVKLLSEPQPWPGCRKRALTEK